jgi:hypothetical protein
MSFIPITNIDLRIDYGSGSGNLRIFSNEKIKAISNEYFSLKNPYFQIALDK